jgi:molecular chaperone DnaK
MEEMIREAEANKEEDAKRRDLVELKNEGDKALHNTEKSLKEHSSKLSSDVIAEIEKELTALRTTLSNQNLGLEEVENLRTQV